MSLYFVLFAVAFSFVVVCCVLFDCLFFVCLLSVVGDVLLFVWLLLAVVMYC